MVHPDIARSGDATRHGDDGAVYRTLIDNATDMLVLADAGFQRLYVSPSCIDIVGYTPEHVLGKGREKHIDSKRPHFATRPRGSSLCR